MQGERPEAAPHDDEPDTPNANGKQRDMPENEMRADPKSAESGGVALAKSIEIFVDRTMPSLSSRDIENEAANQPNNAVSNTERSLVGETIDNQYKVLGVLGKGGMSVVYKASHVVLNIPVAIKTMHAHLVNDASALMRFKQEAQAAIQLDHPNVIKVYGFGTMGGDNAQPYIVMDFVEGESLSEAIKTQGLMPVRATLRICRQVCLALEHAHSKGVIHRDLKPSNIMLLSKEGDANIVKLVDFGIAKLLPQEGEQAHRLTQTGEIFGSPMYMSPEQCMGQKVDKRSDVYALGCVLYEALCGHPPHHGGNVFETFHKHAAEIAAPLDMPGENKALVERLDAIVFRALEKHPDKRYQSMKDFELDLAQVENELEQGLRSTGLSHGLARQQRTVLRFARAFPKKFGTLILLACVLTTATVWFWQKFNWFFDQHHFVPPRTRWVYYLRARHKPDISAADRQSRLDKGAAALYYLRLKDDPQHYLEGWEQRAKECAKIGADAEEIEARRNVLDLQRKINGSASTQYGEAAEELAGCLMASGDFRGASLLLVDAISIRERTETTTPGEYIKLGLCLGRMGLFEKALAPLKKAIEALNDKDARLSSLAHAVRADQDLALANQHADKRQFFFSAAEHELATAQNLLEENGNLKKQLTEVRLMRAFVNLELGNYKLACSLYAMAMPTVEDIYSHQPAQMKGILDGYAYASWMVGDIFKADELHNRSVALGNILSHDSADSETASP